MQRFIDAFSKLPALGPRAATRLAFHLVNLDRGTLRALGNALLGLETLDRCERCFFFREGRQKLCGICNNASREKKLIMIVEKETDLISIEKIGKFRGHYLVLGDLAERGFLETTQRLRLQHLRKRIEEEMDGKAKEMIVALTPTTFGDFTADLIKHDFREYAEKITTLGRGIPTGGEIEFADEDTLRNAFERRG
jgi:recombination protein RecR